MVIGNRTVVCLTIRQDFIGDGVATMLKTRLKDRIRDHGGKHFTYGTSLTEQLILTEKLD